MELDIGDTSFVCYIIAVMATATECMKYTTYRKVFRFMYL